MNKRSVFVIAFVTLIAMGGVFTFLRSGSDDPLTQSTTSDELASKTSEPLSETNSAREAQGLYVAYSKEAVANATGDRVLFFHAPWCAQCRSIESGINAQGVPTGLTILKVDYDSNQDLRKKYGVTLQTTFVKIAADGSFISKYVAYDEPTFDAVKRNYL